MKAPGIVWTVLLVALPLVAVWLEQYFAAAQWAVPLAGLLLIVAKVIEVAAEDKPAAQPQSTLESFSAEAPEPEPERSTAARLLWG